MGVEDMAASLKDKVENGDFDSSIKFVTGDGVLVIDGSSISTEDQETACTVKVSSDDLQSIIDGDLDPTAAFMQGKLSVEGDMGVAMKLGSLLG
ncbi:MAG: SCP2 sterol-binding domain-containing protein [Pseudomonadota bacterium]